MQMLTLKRMKGSLVPLTLIGVLMVAAPGALEAQTGRFGLVRLFRLEGSFSEELSVKSNSDDASKKPPFVLTNVRLEAENVGFVTRIRTILTLANDDPKRQITEAAWRVDVYDPALRAVSARVIQSDKVRIYPGETGAVSAKFGAVLPDRMIVLFQLFKVSFADGAAWSSPEECSAGKDLRTISCESK